jgi:disulfide bond formation protein DsbB
MQHALTSSPTLSFGLRRIVPLGLQAVAIAALATANIAQYAYGLEPCVLCLWQRAPYAVVILLSLVALAVGGGGGRGTRRVAVLTGLGAVAFLIGGAIAFYHVGVEQHWWHSVTGCGGGLPAAMSVADLQAALSAPPPKACDAVDWSFVGLSMATWNALLSPLFAIAAGLAALALLRQRPEARS